MRDHPSSETAAFLINTCKLNFTCRWGPLTWSFIRCSSELLQTFWVLVFTLLGQQHLLEYIFHLQSKGKFIFIYIPPTPPQGVYPSLAKTESWTALQAICWDSSSCSWVRHDKVHIYKVGWGWPVPFVLQAVCWDSCCHSWAGHDERDWFSAWQPGRV